MSNQNPTLVIMAAGMGSRFGGLKQIEPVDPEGHIIIDFSLFDAWRAGFRDVVFIIKREMEAEFQECIGDRMEQYFQTSTACFQAQSAGMGAKSGWTLWLNSGIAATSVRNPKRHSQTNINVGAKRTVTTSVKQRHTAFTLKPMDILASCRNLKRRSCSWNRLLCSSERLLLPLLHSSMK